MHIAIKGLGPSFSCKPKGGSVKTNTRIGVGIAIIILGLLVILTPRYLFPVCDFSSDGDSSNAATMAAAGGEGILLAQNGGTDQMAQAMDDMDTSTTMDGMEGMDHGDTAMEMDEEVDHGTMQSTGHMQCYYTYRGALMLGMLIMLIGVAVMLATTAEATRLLALVLGGTAVAVITLPTYVLPICENPQMECHDGSEPMLIVIGAVILAVAGAMAVFAGRKQPGADQ